MAPDAAPPPGMPPGPAPETPDPPAGARIRRRAASVRFRVTALATLALVAVLAVTGVVLVRVQVRVLTDGLDEAIQRRADDLAAVVATATAQGEGGGGRGSRLPGDDDDVVAQLLDADGRVVAASPALAGAPALDVPGGTADGPVAARVTVGGGEDERVRALARPVDTPDGPRTLVVVGETEDVTESAQALGASLLVAVPVVAALLAALVWWLVGRTLRPVEAIRAEVAGMGGTDLDRRVPVPPTDDEVARLARTMNGMLARVEEASRRQQRFVADASHELRTPLARVRAELEVDDAHPHTADPVATRRSVLAEVEGLQRLVADLLYLARSDAGVTTVERRTVDLDDVVLATAATLPAADGLRVDTSGVTAAQVRGSADLLARVVANLADNAVRHARSTVTFTLAEDGDHVVLTVADDGTGIPPADAERAFDRFTRLDAARAGGAGGTGLGLAIARDVVERYGGTIAVDPAHAPGARLVVTLPRSPWA